MIQCAFENGNQATLRHVGANVIIVRGDEVLLVKRAPHIVCPGMYGFPGGYMERGEKLVQAAKRECLEETGYDCVVGDLFLITDNPNRKNDERQNVIFTFLAEALELVGQSDSESTDVKWFKLDNLPEEMAFDHRDVLEKYKEYRQAKFLLPVFIK